MCTSSCDHICRQWMPVTYPLFQVAGFIDVTLFLPYHHPSHTGWDGCRGKQGFFCPLEVSGPWETTFTLIKRNGWYPKTQLLVGGRNWMRLYWYFSPFKVYWVYATVCKKNAVHKYWRSQNVGFCKKKEVVLLYLFLMSSILIQSSSVYRTEVHPSTCDYGRVTVLAKYQVLYYAKMSMRQ